MIHYENFGVGLKADLWIYEEADGYENSLIVQVDYELLESEYEIEFVQNSESTEM